MLHNYYFKYEDLFTIQNFHSFEIKYKYYHENKKSLRMIKHEEPVSITQKEFNYIKDTIINNDLKRGYEVATAFGISSLACGLGFQQTGGKIVTMDAYIEEQFNSSSSYTDKKDVTFTESDGLKSVNQLIKYYKLEEVLYPKVGWSPTNTIQSLSEVFDLTKEKLDFVFIDAGHWDEAVIADLEVILPYLAEKCYIFFHDVHCFTEKFTDFLIKNFGKSYEIVVPLNAEGDQSGYNLSLLIKG